MGMSKELLKGLMDNPNFKKWLGDSQYLGEMIHGSPNNSITKLDSGKDIAAFLAPKDGPGGELASHFAGRGEGASVYPVHAKAAKIFDPSNSEHVLDVKTPGFPIGGRSDWDSLENPDMIRRLKSRGYDAMLVEEGYSGGPTNVAIFSPTQVKSIFNQGTFDPTDTNFLKSAGLMTAGAGAAAYGMSPDDAEAAKLPKVLDFGDVKLPLDAKGLATLYHATTPEAADKIVASKSLRSAGEPSVYFSTSKEGTGYGPAVVEAKVPGSMLQMDDAFPDGRADFRVDKPTLPLSYAKRIAGLGLTGAGAYGLMGGDSDANAMSYIGPKGMANLLGPDVAKSMVSEAEQLAAKGVDNEAVRQATGVFKGMDGKWRYELDDSGASLTPWTKDTHGQSNISWDKRPGPAVAMNTEDFISHPSLERAYWPTRDQGPDIFYQHVPGDTASRYVPSQDAIYMSAQSRNADKEGMGTALHELQHAIQQREGFARGGSPSTAHLDPEVLATKDLNDWLSIEPYYREANGDVDLAKQLYEKSNPGSINSFRFQYLADNYPNKIAKDLTILEQLADKNIPTDPNQFYQRLAGEIEARDTAKRMDLTPEQRRATPPDLRDNAIVRFDGGQAASVPQGREWAKEAGSNTPNVAQAVSPADPFAASPQSLAALAALTSSLREKDQPLEDTYQPADLLTAFLTGGGGLLPRVTQAAIDPVVSAGMDYLPKFADAINPRNIITGLMR